MAALIRERQDEYAALMTREMGKTLKQGKQECELCAAICDYTAEHGAQVLADEPRSIEGSEALITYQAQGVIYGIQPWNFPLYQVIRYSSASLMAGNAVLLKHASNVWGIEKVKMGDPTDPQTDLGPLASRSTDPRKR